MSNWGWHSFPNIDGYTFEDTHSFFEVNGRLVPYRNQIIESQKAIEAANYLRSNPHRLHLGLIGLDLRFENGEKAKITDLTEISHQLDLWSGLIKSDFVFDGEEVHIEVYCHQEEDVISVKLESSLLSRNQLAVSYRFPGPSEVHMGSAIDLSNGEMHTTKIVKQEDQSTLFERSIDTTSYYVHVTWEGEALMEGKEAHMFSLHTKEQNKLLFSTHFKKSNGVVSTPSFDQSKKSSTSTFNRYWQNGGFVDLGECTDSRAHELERRVILSQYLTRIQSTGNLPPAETGLTANSWYGKFHMEMIWWHVAHFAQWSRGDLVEKQIDYYFELFDQARKTAEEQGYKGVRWQKMLGDDGENAPSRIGSFLIWQQPHIIWFAEQMYRNNPSQETLEKFEVLVNETAEFMADFLVWNEGEVRFDLAPPLIPAQEHWDKMKTFNPPFELAYWYWGLTMAQEWNQRLGKEANAKWEEVRQKLASPDSNNGTYLGIQGATDSYSSLSSMKDHPMVLGSYGILPYWEKIDTSIMKNTLDTIVKKWDWDHTWGWDYPMVAMTAIRLGEPSLALDLLLKDVPKNKYLPNGHNYQTERLKVYLPGNGGLLYTVAMMCAGWDGNESTNIGFPNDGTWNIKWENLKPVF
jgi:hypothetical protein